MEEEGKTQEIEEWEGGGRGRRGGGGGELG